MKAHLPPLTGLEVCSATCTILGRRSSRKGGSKASFDDDIQTVPPLFRPKIHSFGKTEAKDPDMFLGRGLGDLFAVISGLGLAIPFGVWGWPHFYQIRPR